MKRIIPALVAFFVACSLIFYKFTQVPLHLAFDEVEFARIALYLGQHSYTPYVTLANGHTTLYYYVLLLSLKLFDTTVFGLRFPAAIFGIANIVLFYFIVQRITKQKLVAFTAALVLATSRWYFGFARFSFEATFLIFWR